MKNLVILVIGVMSILMFATAAKGSEPTVADVNHWELQAVDEDGYGTYSATDKVILQGVILNNPEDMLDPTPGNNSYMGGQWQIYVQGEGNDYAGTAVWLGQYYSRVSSSDDYTDEQLLAELCRINHDPCTGYTFAAGDRVKVTGWYKFYKGKTNVNEKHDVNDFFDFTIELLEPGVGLPQPEVITLNDVKDANDDFIFDASRLTGCEYYQGRLVRVSDVNIVDPNDWAPDSTLTIKDANGLTLPVKLGIGDGFSRYECPSGQIDVVGIFDQESTGYTVCKDGYRIWVTNYDGNGLVLMDRGHPRGRLSGDINNDFGVDFKDFAELAADWLEHVPGLFDCGLP
jgi:hypothetical protein